MAVFVLHPVLLYNDPYQLAVLLEPVIFTKSESIPIAVLLKALPPPRPIVSPLIVASAVVTKFPDTHERRNDSILFLLKTRSLLSVVPMNWVSGLVPPFPESPHAELVIDFHVALPDASVVRIYPSVGAVVRRNPENDPVPATSSL